MERDKVGEKAEVILEIVGEEKFIEMCKIYGGGSVYLPTYTSVVREKRNSEIVKRYNGFNEGRLASEYRMSKTHVRRILKEYGVRG
ncbi:Mor transcription activator family protein [Romboutsia sp.]|uniref:Mor transcription activator family protein n=1 Tax=Romboutsia sp. TaxID=1965302 RepID=UPI003F3522A6